MYETVEDWIEGSFWSLDFEWADCRVHPFMLFRDGEEVEAEKHIDELDKMIDLAYRTMENATDWRAELLHEDNLQRVRDIRLAQKGR